MRIGYHTETPVRTNVSVGDKIIVYKKGGDGNGPTIHAVSIIARVTDNIICEKGLGARRFSRRTHKQIGGQLTFEVATEAQAASAVKVLEDERERRRIHENLAHQAAYDALPESVKLARKLRWLCDVTSEGKVAGMPIETLRSAVDFLESHGKDMV